MLVKIKKLTKKKKKKIILMYFDAFRHYDWAKDILLHDKFSSRLFICLSPLFQRLISQIIFMKEFIPLTVIAMKIGKRTISHLL